MEKLDLTKILKNCPKGWKFWSSIFGEVEFDQIVESIHLKNVKYVNVKKNNVTWSFYSDATFPIGNIKSDEILLYPSKYQRDWSKFTAPWYKKKKFDSKTLKPFDRVLVRDSKAYKWKCEHFSYFNEGNDYPYMCSSDLYAFCIPYNEETKHLIGTNDEAPEYYRYWED